MNRPQWLYFYSGSVVEWEGAYWVVKSTNHERIELISMSSNNVCAGPSTTWPDDPANRIDSVSFIAGSIKDFISKSLLSQFGELFK